MKWLKKKFVNTNDLNGDLFGFDDVQNQYLDIFKPTKQKNKIDKSAKNSSRNNDKFSKEQIKLDFSKNTDVIIYNSINGTKQGLSNKEITQEQIEILKKCREESSAAELRKILKRTNKTKFKKSVLDPLIKLGFFELTVPSAPKSPKQKYRFTGKFVRKIKKS